MSETFIVEISGAMMQRGFSLYAWEITTPDGETVLWSAPGFVDT
jgi:hypothetical protein